MPETYKKLVEFLGLVMGDECKIVLFDLTLSPPAVVAIANGTMEGGKGVGAPLTHVAREIIESGEWHTQDYKSSFLGQVRSGAFLKSSYFFIKDDNGQLIGMLSLNFRTERYLKLCNDILHLGGLSGLLAIQPEEEALVSKHFSESFPDVAELIASVLQEHFGETDAIRLTQEERMTVMQALRDQGVFLIKGAVPETARALACSEATIYRYLSKLPNKA